MITLGSERINFSSTALSLISPVIPIYCIFHSPTLHYLRSYLSTSVPRTISASNNNPVRHTSQNHKAPHGPLPLPPFHRRITSIHHPQFPFTTPTPTQANPQTDRIHSIHQDATSHFLDPSRTANLTATPIAATKGHVLVRGWIYRTPCAISTTPQFQEYSTYLFLFQINS